MKLHPLQEQLIKVAETWYAKTHKNIPEEDHTSLVVATTAVFTFYKGKLLRATDVTLDTIFLESNCALYLSPSTLETIKELIKEFEYE